MIYGKARIVLLLVVWGLLGSAAAQTPAVVQGTVVDGKGQAMPFVNVQLVDTTDGAATDQEGQFRFTTTRQGRQTVQATRRWGRPVRSRSYAPRIREYIL